MSETASRSRWRRIVGPRYFLVLGLWLVGLIVALVVLVFVDRQVVHTPVYLCPPDCGRPPTGLPVSNAPRFVAPDGSFTVNYPAEGPAFTNSFDANGVTSRWNLGDGGTLRLFGTPANDRVAREVVDDFVAEAFPDSVVSYELPNATVGFQQGYGVVADFTSGKRSDPSRIIVIAAVKNDLALVAAAEGPFVQFGPGVGPGPPSAANLEIAQLMGDYVNSFAWQGEQPR